jgi:drug/metabolite transporter (DMT)-like permease
MADISEIVSFLITLLPFLNAGLVILIIDLSLRELFGLEISKKEFTRQPIQSLVLGLGLIFISNVAYLLLQTWSSQFSPLVLSFLLIVIYFVIILIMTPSEKRKKGK